MRAISVKTQSSDPGAARTTLDQDAELLTHGSIGLGKDPEAELTVALRDKQKRLLRGKKGAKPSEKKGIP